MILGVLYRPPASSVQVFLEDFLSYIGFLSSLSSSFVVCDDFNIHVDFASPLVSEFKSVIDGCCLTQYIEFATHLLGLRWVYFLLSPAEIDIFVMFEQYQWTKAYALSVHCLLILCKQKTMKAS